MYIGASIKEEAAAIDLFLCIACNNKSDTPTTFDEKAGDRR